MAHRYKKKARLLMKKIDKHLKKGQNLRAAKLVRMAKSLDPENGRARAKYKKLVEIERLTEGVHLAAAGPLSDEDKENFARVAAQIDAVTATPAQTGELPKRIWMYWDSGLESAPDIVKKSHETWVKFNPEYEVVLLDRNNLSEYLGFDFTHAMQSFSVALQVAGQSDFIRLALLARHGGVWVDATTYCLKPLQDWLDEAVKPAGFFCFRQTSDLPMQDRILISWFIAAEPNNIIVQRMLRRSFDFLTKPRDVPLIKTGQQSLRDTLEVLDPPDVEMESTGQELIDFAEFHGFYLYFWLFYLFNDVVAEEDMKERWEHVKQQTNRCAKIDRPFLNFSEAYVSKQTYKPMYLQTQHCAERLAFVNDLLAKLDGDEASATTA